MADARSTTKDVLRKWRRVSSTSGLRRASKGNAPTPSVEDTKRPQAPAESHESCHRVRSCIFTLPTEILAQIFKPVDWQSLCFFRLTCKAAHHLILEGEIIRQWAINNVNDQQLRLYGLPPHVNFLHVIEHRRRYHAASQMVNLLAEYIVCSVLCHSQARLRLYLTGPRGFAFMALRKKFRREMMPRILTIQHYLEQLSQTLLLADDVTSNSGQPDYGIREHRLFDRYETQELLAAHKLFLFLCWVNQQMLNRPSYVGTVEGAMRGWISGPLNAFEFRLLVVFGNISALKDLLKMDTYKDRRKAAGAWVRRLDPARDVHWQREWKTIVPRSCELPTKEKADKAMRLRLSEGDVWVDSARSALIERRSLASDSNSGVGTAWQIADFLCEIAGYDVLHDPPTLDRLGLVESDDSDMV